MVGQGKNTRSIGRITTTSFSIKLIAVIAMTIDHFAKIVGQTGIMSLFPSVSLKASYLMVNLMDVMGRMAFPLFAFMVAEGVQRTSSIRRYIGRLMLFALISEPFYYFAFNGQMASFSGFLESLSYFHLSNVFFTLCLGAIAAYACQTMEEKMPEKCLLTCIPVIAAFSLFGEYIGCDYGAMGIILIAMLYLSKTKISKITVIMLWSIGLYIVGQGMGNWSQDWTYPILNCLLSLFSCFLIGNYSGKRGLPVKWCFYIYYPVHLLLLILLEYISKQM